MEIELQTGILNTNTATKEELVAINNILALAEEHLIDAASASEEELGYSMLPSWAHVINMWDCMCGGENGVN